MFLIHTHPLVIDPAVLAAVFQRLQAFSKLSQKSFLTLCRRVAILGRQKRFFPQYQVGPTVFFDQVKARYPGYQGTVVPAVGKFAQRYFLVVDKCDLLR